MIDTVVKKACIRSFVQLVFVCLFCSCENMIEYSPYKAGVKLPYKDLNIKALEQIQARSSQSFEPFVIGVFGDTHTYYDDFVDQVKHFNSIDTLDFVVHMGDITLSGIYREFLWYSEIVSDLKHPLITLIGNHDFLSNGEYMYREMFGPFNFTIVYNDCLFVFFEDIIWEKDVKDPDFDWLEEQLKNSGDFRYRFVFSHIPPWSGEFSKGNEFYFNMLLDKYDVDLSVHGHMHSYYLGKRYSSGPLYLTTSESKARETFVICVGEGGLELVRDELK